MLYYTGCRESRGWADIKQPSKNKFSYNNIIKLRLIYKKDKHFEVIKHFFQTIIFENVKILMSAHPTGIEKDIERELEREIFWPEFYS